MRNTLVQIHESQRLRHFLARKRRGLKKKKYEEDLILGWTPTQPWYEMAKLRLREFDYWLDREE